LQAGFDPAYSRASVGYVLTGHVIKQLIAAGVRRYDFGVGGGPDKTRWGAREGVCIDIYFSQPNYRGTLAFGFMHHMKQTKEWLRPRVKGVAWQIVAWVRFRLRGY
jgi:CelD/BcsL family acetyltransferase involved in cellulose biosynthesis